jgi:hypothetical protein
MRLDIGELVTYHRGTYEVLDRTPDGSLIIGKQGVCATEICEDETQEKKFHRLYHSKK